MSKTQLKKYLEKNGIKSELLIGSVSQDEREVIVKKFNNPNNNEFSIVIANPFCVAESISLHKGCHNAIYLEEIIIVQIFYSLKIEFIE